MKISQRTSDISSRSLPQGVVALGLVSMFMDISSEMIHSLLPIFLVSTLGVGMLAVGIIEGIAEATASVMKLFSGALSDWVGRRKPLVLLGYGLAALTKPLFPLATGVAMVLGARFFDRIGKGVRDAPRDALIADLTPENARGVAYGLRQALDTVGAFVGPLIALALMVATGNQFRLVFWIAVAPAFIAVALVAFGVQEPKPSRPTAQMRLLFRRTDLARLHRRYWFVVALAAVLSLARFSQAFLLLRAENVGLAVPFIPSVVLVMNIVYASSAYPFGALSDKVPRLTLLVFGIVFLIAANIVLAGAQNILAVFFGAVLWGLHMGASEGLLSALVADSCPEVLRGTAFGIFNLASGTALLLASIVAGWLWAALGPSSTFIAGAIFAGLSLMGIATWAPRKEEPNR
jgi:MFS family permease